MIRRKSVKATDNEETGIEEDGASHFIFYILIDVEYKTSHRYTTPHHTTYSTPVTQ